MDSVCCACLASGRRRALVGEHCGILRILLGEGFDTEANGSSGADMMLCWECQALLSKVHIFRRRARAAQALLREQSYHTNFTSQSSLKCVYKDTYDLIVEENDRTVNLNKMIKCDEDDNFNDNDIAVNDNDNCDYDNDMKIIDDNFVACDVIEAKIKEKHVKTKQKIRKKKKSSKNVIKRNKNYTVHRVRHQKYKEYMSERPKTDEKAESYIEEGKIEFCKDNSYKCSFCCMKFGIVADLEVHLTKEHRNKNETPHECNMCSDNSTAKDLDARRESHLNDYRCNLCNSNFATEKSFKSHFKNHKEMFKCNHCEVIFGSAGAAAAHARALHGRCRCAHCGREYAAKSKLIAHLQVHEKQECNVCKRDFPSRTKLVRHKLNVHGIYTRKTQQASPEAAYCVECDKQFVSVPALKKHLYSSVRHGAYRQKSVPCPECGKVFARLGYMKNHRRLYHSEENKHQCELCGKRFVSAFTVKQHVRLVHDKLPAPRDKLCGACGRGFATNRVLTQHMRTHTGERPHGCARCPARFRQQYSAQAHYRTQHQDKAAQ